MSQFYDSASLVMVPSGYKNGKIYSQKPLSTSGELSFSRASTATRVNASGLIESVASGVPRLDYSGGASCPSLLLEPQRTNLALFSEQFDNVYFSKVNAAINANALISPDGYTNADKFVATATTGVHYLSVPVTSVSPAVLSVFAKAAEETVFAIGNATGSSGVVFNLSNGTITSGTGGTIENYGNGWYRCSYYRTSWLDFQYFSLRGNAASYTGNGTDGIYLYGVQFEAGAYATSYIPTLSSAVTRVEETAIKTGASAIIGQTEGTIFVEFKRVPKGVNYQTVFSLQGASSAQLIEAYFNNADTLIVGIYNSGAQYQTLTSALTEGTYKIAVAYKENDFAFYVNGVQISTDNNGTVPALSSFNLGGFTYVAGYPLSDGIKQALLFKTRLSNADLATLTTL